MFALRLLPPPPVPNIPRIGPQGMIIDHPNAQQAIMAQQALAPVQGFPGLFAAIPMPSPATVTASTSAPAAEPLFLRPESQIVYKEGNPNA